MIWKLSFRENFLSNASGILKVTLPNLIRFDPNDPDADIEDWCSINEIIVTNKRLEDIDLLITLMHALRVK